MFQPPPFFTVSEGLQHLYRLFCSCLSSNLHSSIFYNKQHQKSPMTNKFSITTQFRRLKSWANPLQSKSVIRKSYFPAKGKEEGFRGRFRLRNGTKLVQKKQNPTRIHPRNLSVRWTQATISISTTLKINWIGITNRPQGQLHTDKICTTYSRMKTNTRRINNGNNIFKMLQQGGPTLRGWTQLIFDIFIFTL